MNKEKSIFLNHLHDIAEKAFEERTTFSTFLNLQELYFFESNKKEFEYIEWRLSGDNLDDRRMLCFGEFKKFPIKQIIFSWDNDTEINHRDVLGTIMSLGIERKMIGNILVEEKVAIVEVCEIICDLICHEVNQIKKCDVVANVSKEKIKIQKKFKREEYICASERLDVVISSVYKISRKKSSELLKASKVYIPNRLLTVSSKIKKNNIVSVRGMGKFKYEGIIKFTKKDKIIISIKKYI